MRAVVLEQTGGPEQLVVRDLPEPAPGPSERLVNVRAAGINFMDVLVRSGRYPQPPELPWVPGAEVAGELDGQAVMGMVRHSGGGYAEQVAIDDDWIFPLPAGAKWSEGAAFLMTFVTAWIPLTRQAHIRPGTRVLVTAAAGGVGSAGVQVAKTLGGRVVAAASSEEKLEVPRSLGADECVVYDDLESIDPVDVVFDPVGGELLTRCLPLLRPLGSAILIGFAGGAWAPADPARLVGRNIGLLGFYLGRLMQLDPELVRVAARDVIRLWEEHAVRPVVGGTFALEDAPEAHRLIEERRSTGKLVLLT
jgi:NADPH:quinone reductase